MAKNTRKQWKPSTPYWTENGWSQGNWNARRRTARWVRSSVSSHVSCSRSRYVTDDEGWPALRPFASCNDNFSYYTYQYYVIIKYKYIGGVSNTPPSPPPPLPPSRPFISSVPGSNVKYSRLYSNAVDGPSSWWWRNFYPMISQRWERQIEQSHRKKPDVHVSVKMGV